LHDKDTEHVESWYGNNTPKIMFVLTRAKLSLLFMDESGNVSQALPINSDLSIEIGKPTRVKQIQ
jgi:hypothetical protein